MLHLRSILYADLEMIRHHRNRPDTNKWLEFQNHITENEQIKWYESGHANNFKILTSGNSDIGLARLCYMKESCSVGCDLFEQFRGRGLAESCFRHVMQEALKFAKHLDLWVFKDNIPAYRTYTKCGFVIDTITMPKLLFRQHSNNLHEYIRMVYK